jgi:hypothetical protein
MDKTSKLILCAIALGLWFDVAARTIAPARAEESYGFYFMSIVSSLNSIQSSVSNIEKYAKNKL